jgi:hypothetical protein
MDADTLLGKGYFAKELPPPFSTELYAKKWSIINSGWQATLATLPSAKKRLFGTANSAIFSIPKLNYQRNQISIPPPLCQGLLSQTISDNWIDLQQYYNKSTVSCSKPIPDVTKNRAIKTLKTFGEFRHECLIHSFGSLYEIKTDISRFYSSIYTHILPWVLHSKAVAKNRKNDKTLLGNLLDIGVRACRANQTNGIPIGPDTSLILAELITCEIDNLLEKKFKGNQILGFRYIDDFYIYCQSQGVAEKVLNALQGFLTDHHLDSNEQKTAINRFPFIYDSDWTISLSTFKIRSTKQGQATDLARFFSHVIQKAIAFPKEHVLGYAVRCLQSHQIHPENWQIFEAIVLKISLYESATLPDVLRFLITYRAYVNKDNIKKIISQLIDTHAHKGHHFEVAWALWMAHTFKIKLTDRLATKVFNSKDSISILIALDLRAQNLINRTVSITALENAVDSSSLFDENWLFAYEALLKGWLSNPTDIIGQNDFFSILRTNNVAFYDGTRQLLPFTYNTKKSEPSTKKTSISQTGPSTFSLSKNPVSTEVEATLLALSYDGTPIESIPLESSEEIIASDG